MPRKSRRSKARQRAKANRRIAATYAEARTSPSQPKPVSPLPSKAREFTGRYQHVIPELRRIGIIAGAMIVVLIVLSFFLR